MLALLAIPALGMHTKVTGINDMPRDAFPALKTYDRIDAAFPAEEPNAMAVVKAPDASAPAVKAAIAQLEQPRAGRRHHHRTDHDGALRRQDRRDRPPAAGG